MKANKNAVLARRVAWELTDEEMKAISGGLDEDSSTDWSEDYKNTSTSGTSSSSTNNGGDADVKSDF